MLTNSLDWRRLVPHANVRLTVFVLLAGAAMTFATASAASPAASGHRAGKIAFLRLVPGPRFGGQLFVVRPNGSQLRRVTPPNTTVYSYAWSPDGRRIAFIDAYQHSLWLVQPDGTGLQQLLSGLKLASVDLSWSPDGKRIAIISPGLNASMQNATCAGLPIYIVPIDGAQPTAVPGASAGCSVAWAPRGSEIAYEGSPGIWVVHPDGTDRRHVSRRGFGPEWSADGAQLAFKVVVHRRNGFTDRYHAFAVVDVDGRHFHVVTTHAYTEYGVAWSPHRREIAYGRAERKGIYVVGSGGRNNRRVTSDSPPQAGWGALAWSPNGRSIVYATNRTGNGDLYAIGAGGRGKVQLTSTPDTDIAPSWVVR